MKFLRQTDHVKRSNIKKHAKETKEVTMKRVIALAMAIGMMLPSFAGVSWARTDAKTTDVTVSVNQSFSLTLSNQANLHFGAHNPDHTDLTGQLGLTVNNNHGIVWTLSLFADALLRSGGAETITGGNFQFYVSGGGGVGTTAATNVPSSETTFYTAAASEYSVSGFALGLNIIVRIPTDQRAGDYSTTLHVTLTDASV